MTEATTRTAPGTREFEGLTIPEPGKFVLDPFHTRIGFSARHLMVSKVRGQFEEFTGGVTVADDPLQSTAEAVIVTESINTRVEMRDNHLKSSDFLEVPTYPEITFRNARVVDRDGATLKVVGDLTIKDVTRPVELTVEYEGVTTTPAAMGGKQVIGFSITGEIDREDWGINYNQPMQNGGVVVGKKIRLEIEGEAVRQD